MPYMILLNRYVIINALVIESLLRINQDYCQNYPDQQLHFTIGTTGEGNLSIKIFDRINFESTACIDRADWVYVQ